MGATTTTKGPDPDDASPSPIPSICVDGKDASDGDAKGGDVVDAGLRSLDHYKRALPPWRYRMRQALLPLVRWETPYLAYFQDKVRTPALDSYFAITANFGTHTFYMIGLPIMFWLDYARFGKGIVQILASGVFLSGFIKDMLSLPRPLSPPLQRITMSESVALEYGFPSTHSTNAVSVAMYAILNLADAHLDPSTERLVKAGLYFYAVSIVVGRLYCGMHGFLDVIFGSLLGFIIGGIEFYLMPSLDVYEQLPWTVPAFMVLAVIILVRIHPEPADDCPCFDDSVAFAGVVIGMEIGLWRAPRLRQTLSLPPDMMAHPSWPVAVGRLVIGIVAVFLWREIMKPTLLRVLPHLFRLIETLGLNLPRRFFRQASEYGRIPDLLRLHTDNVLPSLGDIPVMVRNLRNAKRGRSVSIGPQSAADAYETLAYRERRRRESIGSQGSLRSKSSFYDLKEMDEPTHEPMAAQMRPSTTRKPTSDTIPFPAYNEWDSSPGTTAAAATATASGVQKPNTLAQYEEMMGQGTVVVNPRPSRRATSTVSLKAVAGTAGGAAGAAGVAGAAGASGASGAAAPEEDSEPELFIGRKDELGEREMFEKLVQPRVRYDVEVVTKLVVYTGIGWIAVEIVPVLFCFLGLGKR